ncbi:hypothetical protein Ferp_0559 [Ferroglobus placidus DSM 10642]|uniref:Uncharacterized protein n=1 Tax=Ferroglobus placidus (strain DSM 10642 / AEDII12DO) TaxID=589924 RepID=D3S399_FERPA|nr:hypothetical protein [Ferroglobus placidus]ADC64732.1 hypothetical protein Ferp_0559 [Ferroglobus placidus DSM 10642]
MRTVVAEFCAECLESTLKQSFFTDEKECSECLSKVYFKARIPQEIAEEIRRLHDLHQLEYGPLTILYAAAGLVRLEYADAEPEPMSEEEVLERIEEGIRGVEGYAYDIRNFVDIIEVIEHAESEAKIDKDRLRKLLKVVQRLKKVVLAEIL